MFEALSQPTRLMVFRLLVEAGRGGMAAGRVAEALAVRQNTMSAHLGVLARSGLVVGERDGRTIRYRLDFDAVRGLIVFLLSDCCGGRAELCGPLFAELRQLEKA